MENPSTSRKSELESRTTKETEFKSKAFLQDKSTNFIDELRPTIQFSCESCGLSEMCHYEGGKPPFVTGKLELREKSYVLRDPFAPPPPYGKSKAEYFLIIGTNCSMCQKLICKYSTCSFFYGSTFCIQCAQAWVSKFPKEVQTKLKKQISANFK